MKNNIQNIGQEKTQNLDRVVLVNEQDEVIGQLDKVEAHLGSGKLHRAVSVFLFNQKGELLVQRRSQFKIVAACQWGNTICGNVRPGESYQECAVRRLKEELGITGVELDKIGKLQYQVEFENGYSENEIDTVFVGSFSGRTELNPEEVLTIDWIEFEKLLSDGKVYAPWVEKIVSDEGICERLTEYHQKLICQP